MDLLVRTHTKQPQSIVPRTTKHHQNSKQLSPSIPYPNNSQKPCAYTRILIQLKKEWKRSISERSKQRENVCVRLSVCDAGFYFVRPSCLLIFSISSRYRESALALARRGEYITVEGVIAWASRALFKYSKYESRSPRAW